MMPLEQPSGAVIRGEGKRLIRAVTEKHLLGGDAGGREDQAQTIEGVLQGSIRLKAPPLVDWESDRRVLRGGGGKLGKGKHAPAGGDQRQTEQTAQHN